MKYFQGEKVVVKSWCEDPEFGAITQAKNAASLPNVFSHVALMPDAHEGFGVPIGAVVALENAISPNMVGVDIGCGVVAVKSSLLADDVSIENRKKIMQGIREVIPLGFGRQKQAQDDKHMPYNGKLQHTNYNIVKQELASAYKQVGTLGGGNHFIELQVDEEGFLWIMIHSGSRNLGKKVCDHYNAVANALNLKWQTGIPTSYKLAFLPIDSIEGQQYLLEMQYCLEFAKCNRALMVEQIKEVMRRILGWSIRFDDNLDAHHNYATIENHFGKNIWLHRKGATSAKEGELGIIPGSQGTKSYIVRGKGNKESFMSCSHGAGRKMSRRAAKENLDLEKEIAILDKQGIVHGIRNINDLDEAAGAYKDISLVMSQQTDLIDIVTELSPIAVIKG